jgi:hypothetical protein
MDDSVRSTKIGCLETRFSLMGQGGCAEIVGQQQPESTLSGQPCTQVGLWHQSQSTLKWSGGDSRVTKLIAIGLVLFSLGSVRTYAQADAQQVPVDMIYYAPAVAPSSDMWSHRAAERLAGKIEELDDQRLLYLEGEKRRELPSNRVTRVEPVWRTPKAEAAHKLFIDRKYREAKEAIPQAATNDLPRWQQRFLVAEFVDVLTALGDTRLAGSVYIKSLAPNQPPPMLYAHLPMNWTSAEPNRELYEVAVQWLEHPNECAQLLGASWLLLGPDTESARGKLSKLQNSKIETIAALAVAQAWRMVPPPETESKISEWFEYRDRLIEPLQVGPTEFIAERLARVGMHDLAVGQWSRIATLHADHPYRAAAALTAAQRMLTQQGRADEAKRFQIWAEQFQLK